MGLGTSVRTRLGRFEQPAIDLYRGIFISVEDLARTLSEALPEPALVGEIGCGDGAVVNAMATRWQHAKFIGVDPSPSAGRLYVGDPERAVFRAATSSELLGEFGGNFDITVMVDVLHHVLDDQRLAVLQDAAALTAAGGHVVFKDWEKRPGLAHLLCYTADRYVSGDATVRFMDRPELERLIQKAMPGWETVRESTVPPRRNNLLWILRKPATHG